MPAPYRGRVHRHRFGLTAAGSTRTEVAVRNRVAFPPRGALAGALERCQPGRSFPFHDRAVLRPFGMEAEA